MVKQEPDRSQRGTDSRIASIAERRANMYAKDAVVCLKTYAKEGSDPAELEDAIESLNDAIKYVKDVLKHRHGG